MKRSYFPVFLLCLSFSQTYTQQINPIEVLVQSEIMHLLDSFRIRAEKRAKDFKAIQHLYSVEEVQTIADAYDASATQFNYIFFILKKDLLNKEKREFIKNFPENYSKQFATDIYQAIIFFEQKYMVDFTLVTNGQIGCSCERLLDVHVMSIIELIKNGFAALKESNIQWDELTESLIDNKLIVPFKLKQWSEL